MSRRRLAILGLAFALAAQEGLEAQTQAALSPADAERLEKLATELDQLRTQLGIPGLSAVVLRDQKVIWTAGLGFADLANRVPATPDTPYEVASLSKLFASTLLLQLVEQGKLDLDDPMSKYSSSFQGDAVKVRHVFTHTSQGTPGETFQYNGNLFDNLSDVVKALSGSRYRAVLSREILDRLGVTATSPGNDLADDQPVMRELLGSDQLARYAAAVRNLAKPYRLYGDGEIVATREGQFGIGAANGVVSSVTDLAKFDIALDRHQFVRPETQALAWTAAVSNSGRTLPYGLGWMVQQTGPVKLVWHNGLLPDLYSALYLKVPDRGMTLILLANSDAVSAPFTPGRGDVLKSAFACTFLKLFVFPKGDDQGCSERSSTAVREWLAARKQSGRGETSVAPSLLAAYMGRYEVRPGTEIIILVKDGHLIRQGGSGEIELFPESDTSFFGKSVDLTYTFERDATGNVLGVRIRREGQNVLARRIPEAQLALRDSLIDLEKQSWVAWQRRDGAFFERFLSDDHVEIGFGGFTNKSTVVAGAGSSACVVASYTVDDFRMALLEPNVALLTYRAAQQTTCNSNPVPSPVWASSLYIRRDGRWQNVVYQQTQAPR